MTLQFYGNVELPEDRKLYEENQAEISRSLEGLLRRINPEATAPVISEAVAGLLQCDDFVRLFYYLAENPAGVALKYFVDDLLSTIDYNKERVRNLLSLLFPEQDVILVNYTRNLTKYSFFGITECIGELLVSSILPQLDMPKCIVQLHVFNRYQHQRGWTASRGDYREEDLAEVDKLVEQYLEYEISLVDLVSRISSMEIASAKHIRMFILQMKDLLASANADPHIAIRKEVDIVNADSRIDWAVKEFGASPDVVAADDLLERFRHHPVFGRDNGNLASMYLILEQHIRGLAVIYETDAGFVTDYVQQLISSLQTAAADYPEFVDLAHVLSAIKVAVSDFEYVPNKSIESDIYWVTIVELQLSYISRNLVNLADQKSNFLTLQKEMDIELGLVNVYLQNIDDENLKLLCVAYTINVLSHQAIFGELLDAFTKKQLESLTADQKLWITKYLSYTARVSVSVDRWLVSPDSES